jgi:hypothetical protein
MSHLYIITDIALPCTRVILKTVPKNLTLVKLDERVRRPSQRSNVLLKIIRIIYLTYMCVTCVNHVTHSSNVLDQILVPWLWWCKNIWALPLSLFLSTNALLFISKCIIFTGFTFFSG